MENCKCCNKKLGSNSLTAPYCESCLDTICNTLLLEGFKKGRVENYESNHSTESELLGYEILDDEAEELVKLAA